MIRTIDITRRFAIAAVMLGLACGLSGCRHRVVIAPLPPVIVPIDPVESAPLDNPPLLEAPPPRQLPSPVAAAAAKPPRERRHVRAAAPAAPEPAPPAAAEPPPAAAAIGDLTAVGESNPQTQQDAADLIASLEKRINALPAQTTDDGKAQVNKIKNFWHDAADALKSGDAEGAKTLATKAKLLLDDLEK